jgi:hypothetical protein
MSRWHRRYLALNLLFGPLVPLSYLVELARHPGQAEALWGGVPEAWRGAYTANMPLAALGYLTWFGWLMAQPCERLPPTGRLFLGTLLVLVPSLLWMPMAFGALEGWLPLPGLLLQLDLALVGAGSLLIAWCLWQCRRPTWGWRLAMAGTLPFCVQTVLLDGLLWPRLFPA